MKKIFYFSIIVFAVLLAGCGEKQETEDTVKATKNEPALSDAAQEVMDREPELVTDDPILAGDKNSGKDYFIGTKYIYEMEERYITDKSDDKSFVNLDYEGLKLDLSVAGSIREDNTKVLLFFVEARNETKQELDLNGIGKLLTDKGEQQDIEGIDEDLKPGAKKKLYTEVELESDMPDDFEIEMPPIYTTDTNKEIGKPMTIKFTK